MKHTTALRRVTRTVAAVQVGACGFLRATAGAPRCAEEARRSPERFVRAARSSDGDREDVWQLTQTTRRGRRRVDRRRHRTESARRPQPALVHAVLALSGLLVGLGTGVASAHWTSGGSGAATASSGTAAPLTTVTAAAATTGLLFPNGPAADVTVSVRNPNPFPVRVTSVQANGPVTGSGGTGDCVTTGVALMTPTAGVPFTVPARSGDTEGAVTVVLSGAAQMTDASDTGCQGAVFTIPVILTGESA